MGRPWGLPSPSPLGDLPGVNEEGDREEKGLPEYPYLLHLTQHVPELRHFPDAQQVGYRGISLYRQKHVRSLFGYIRIAMGVPRASSGRKEPELQVKFCLAHPLGFAARGKECRKGRAGSTIPSRRAASGQPAGRLKRRAGRGPGHRRGRRQRRGGPWRLTWARASSARSFR